MLKFVPFLEGVSILAVLIGLFYSSLTVLPSYERVSLEAFLVDVGELLTLKGIGESFSYGYFIEVNQAFDPNVYSDESNEMWDVPNYFTYPPGGTTATCASVDGRIGCVVWNLDNNGDICPVVKEYSPNPDPNTILYPSINDVVNSAEDPLNEETNAIKTLLSRYSILSSVGAKITPSLIGPGDYKINYEYNYTASGVLFGKNRSSVGYWDFYVEKVEEPRTAECICVDGSGAEVVAATYDVNVVLVNLRGYTGLNELLNERTIILKYFTERTSYSPPASVSTCRMVVR